jgi:hypothetical protein
MVVGGMTGAEGFELRADFVATYVSGWMGRVRSWVQLADSHGCVSSRDRLERPA